MRSLRLATALFVVASLTLAGSASPLSGPLEQAPERNPDVPYVPTPQEVVDAMLTLADVGEDDMLYDLGSGDGRIVITAAKKFGTRGVGIEIDPELVALARRNAKEAGVSDLVHFVEQDLFETDFSEATVVMLYLLPHLNLRLQPTLLRQLRPGARIVSHKFDMGDWKPHKAIEVDGRPLYYWKISERVGPGAVR